MKKTLLASLLFVFGASSASAVQIKEGALYCINSKKIVSYYEFLESGQDDFAQRLLDKADCFYKKKTEEVFLESEQKKYTEVELLSGFTVWTKKENIIR